MTMHKLLLLVLLLPLNFLTAQTLSRLELEHKFKYLQIGMPEHEIPKKTFLKNVNGYVKYIQH